MNEIVSDEDRILLDYMCHKRVKAAQILSVTPDPENGRMALHFGGGERLYVDTEWLTNRVRVPVGEDAAAAAEGGYFVRYEDGYCSWSPADAFEQGYSRIGGG